MDLGRIFGVLFAVFLIFLGVVFLLNNLEIVDLDPFELLADFWPVALILIGLYFIWLRFRPMPKPKAAILSEKLGSEAKGDITFNFGAGELNIAPPTSTDNLFEGSFLLGAGKQVWRSGDKVTVKLERTQWSFPLFFERPGDRWDIKLTNRIPLDVHINTGASRSFIDLTENKIDFIKVSTGASDMTLTMPRASGFSRAVVEGGATDVKIVIPPGVAARIRSKSGLSSLRVDEARFPKENSVYRSRDYDTAENKIDLEISTGISSVTIS